MSSQSTQSQPQKLTDTIKKYFNYPMLLLAVITLLNFKSIINSFIGIFTTIFRNPSSIHRPILGFVLACAPAIIALLLGFFRFEKIKNAKFLIGIACIVIACIKLISSISFYKNFFLHITTDNFYDIYTPLVSAITQTTTILLFLLLGIFLLTKTEKFTAFYVVCFISIAATLFFAILSILVATIDKSASALSASCFVNALQIIALWYIPKALTKPDSAEITKGKLKALVIISVLCLGIALISGAISGAFNGDSEWAGERYNPNDDFYADHDYNDDGKINQSEWEDALGDYMDEIMY